MQDLIDFLHARFAEDLDLANAVDLLSSQMDRVSSHSLPEFAEYMVRWQPNTIRDEIEAKEQLLRSYAASHAWAESPYGNRETRILASGMADAIRILSRAYSDHPEYDNEWYL
jgi:selenocysteine lyase/cysteine desulfurase